MFCSSMVIKHSLALSTCIPWRSGTRTSGSLQPSAHGDNPGEHRARHCGDRKAVLVGGSGGLSSWGIYNFSLFFLFRFLCSRNDACILMKSSYDAIICIGSLAPLFSGALLSASITEDHSSKLLNRKFQT